MPRMSAAQRIELGNEMISRWEAASCMDHRSARFVRDMLDRLKRGKGLTPKQRSWYDSAVLTDPPPPKNEEEVNRLTAAAELPGMEKVSQVLRDFAYKRSRGWDLSEKQLKFMNKLLSQADDIAANGQWVPSPDEKEQIEIGVAFSSRYDGTGFRYRSPGISAALDECKRWLAGDISHVDKWSAGKVMGLCKGDRAAMADAADRWPVGMLVETKDGRLGLVLGPPAVGGHGKPCMPLLVDSQQEDVALERITKRRRKKKTA